jgi:alanyl-tRNA synthetase
LNVSVADVMDRIGGMNNELKDLQEKIAKAGAAEKVDADTLISEGEKVGGVLVVTRELESSNPNVMRQLIDQVRKKSSPAAIFLATALGSDKVVLVAGVSNELVERGIKSGDWVKEIAPIVGGGGGGKPDMAQAGGKLPDKIGEALEKAKSFIEGKA